MTPLTPYPPNIFDNESSSSSANLSQSPPETETYFRVNSSLDFGAEENIPSLDPNGVAIIPALLPTGRPDAAIQDFWDDENAMEKFSRADRHFKFEFVPQGMVARLLVQMLPYIQPFALWANGLLGEVDDDGTALFIEFEPHSPLFGRSKIAEVELIR